MLTAIEFSYVNPKDRSCYWKFKCDCGNECIKKASGVARGHIKSCGCLKEITSYKNSYKHGKSKTKIYHIWQAFKDRCYNQNNKHYMNYGGRGIKVCEEWKNDFNAFHDWAMANGYKDGLTIDRINNDGNYEPSNCRWASVKEQQNNRRCTVFITYNGIMKPLQEWADELGISRDTLMKRKRNGWCEKDIIEKPINKKCSTKKRCGYGN